ncbi:MAG: ABC transporter C-terminal domain-containing protein [Myxococcota bacterium]
MQFDLPHLPQLEAALNDPATYSDPNVDAVRLSADLEAASKEVDRLYARWQELQSS